MKPTLVIMAAGMGSRFGGLKQMEPVGPSGELIIEYSVYDAIQAGYGSVVFIITKQIDQQFREMIGARFSDKIAVDYVYQSLDKLPRGHALPEGRVKPWGTAHAVYCCRDVIKGPFAVINADDFYGRDPLVKICGFLRDLRESAKYTLCMAGYEVESTLSEHGHVTRGVCEVTDDGYLSGITERHRIEKRDGVVSYSDDDENYVPIAPGSAISMNLWGFPGEVIREIEPLFAKFITREDIDLLKAEYYLPLMVSEMLAQDMVSVKVLETSEKWYGMTYREDKEHVTNAIAAMIEAGKYPERLW
jgi:NDP-sugar pyrophosphorylase family protein